MKENIIAMWIAVGFIPMTRRALQDSKVRYKRGEGGAPQAASERIEILVKE